MSVRRASWVCCAAACASLSSAGENAWPTAGADARRTSSVPRSVRPPYARKWIRYFNDEMIASRVQTTAVGRTIYLPTAAGLHAIDLETGKDIWFYRTDKPTGHDATFHEGRLYLPCFDRSIHCIDAATGRRVWTFRAGAGFGVSPLVMAGAVFAGCRDRFFYAIDARSGKLLWKFQTGAPIMYSACGAEGAVYFGSNDMHAYALEAKNGRLLWRSEKLSGQSMSSWWPVVSGGDVIFGTSHAYVRGVYEIQSAVFRERTGHAHQWLLEKLRAEGGAVQDRIVRYLQEHPQQQHCYVLDRKTGRKRLVPPALWVSNDNGTTKPVVVGERGELYFQFTPHLEGHGSNPFMAIVEVNPRTWRIRNLLSYRGRGNAEILLGRTGDEPIGLSRAGGTLIYCDSGGHGNTVVAYHVKERARTGIWGNYSMYVGKTPWPADCLGRRKMNMGIVHSHHNDIHGPAIVGKAVIARYDGFLAVFEGR